jgi:hypothetical protein
MSTIMRFSAAILMALVLGACGEGGGITGPEAPPPLPPAPQPPAPEVVPTTAQISLQSIVVVRNCDENLLFPGPGGYSYWIRVTTNSGASHTVSTASYGSVFGEHRTAGQLDQIPINRTFTLNNMDRSTEISVEFRAIEWDLLDMDSRMADQRATRKTGYPAGTVGYTASLGSEASGCRLRLDYSVSWGP